MRIKDESKVDSIYKATLGLVKERGLAGITMTDISRAASIATGTLYIYFKNKDELIKALFQQCREQSAQQYFADLDQTASVEKQLHKIFTNIVNYKRVYFEVSAFLEQTYHSPFVCITDIKKKQKALSPLLHIMEEGVKTKKLKDIDIDLLVSYMFGVINELVKKSYFSNKKLTPEAINQVYIMFWDGIKL